MFRYLSGLKPWLILLSHSELLWAALSSLGGHKRPLRFADDLLARDPRFSSLQPLSLEHSAASCYSVHDLPLISYVLAIAFLLASHRVPSL
jgi:hypothetical protein